MKRVKTGSIIEAYITEINRFVYIKYIDTREFIEEAYKPFQFRIHKPIFEEPAPLPNTLDFTNLLISPLHLTGFKLLLESGEWRIVGHQSIDAHDKVQHHYKMAWPPNLAAMFDDVKQWRVLTNINNVNYGQIVPYYRCAHLEYAESLGAHHLALRVSIEFLKSALKQETINRVKWDKFDYVLYNRYINMPLYSDVPDEFKGRILPERNSVICSN